MDISITVAETESPLSGVLVSLAEAAATKGKEASRQRKITRETGTVSFVSLPPGIYSLRAILRGYAFSPSLQQIELKEGQHLPIHLKATRVAFDCSGTVRIVGGDTAETAQALRETLSVYVSRDVSLQQQKQQKQQPQRSLSLSPLA